MRNTIYDDVKLIGGMSLNQSFPASAAVNGSAVDTLGADNAAIYAHANLASGTPDAATLAVKLQESADGSTGWTDALDNEGTVIGFTLNSQAADAENEARIEGLGLNRQRYLRAVVTPTFSGGTTPAIIASVHIVQGGKSPRPVNTTVSNT